MPGALFSLHELRDEERRKGSNHTSEAIRQGFGSELLVRFSGGFGKLLIQFAGEV